jgi:hypothetical protein
VEKKNNTYQFLNIIKEEKYNNFTQDEKEKYLIENKIYVPHEDLDHPFFNHPDENGDVLRDHFFTANYVNDLVLREMVSWFVEVGSIFTAEFEGYRERFKIRIDRALDNSDKERIIRNEYEKYSDLLNEDYLIVEEYFLNNTKDGDLYDCICSFDIHESLVLEYISDGIPLLDFRDPFKECDKVRYNTEILKFLKKEMNNITISHKEKVYKPKSTTPSPFNDEIFRTIDAQNWFNETLNRMGAIDNYKNPVKRKFQPICSAIFYSNKCRKDILKYNLELQDYIAFLNKKYKTMIKSKLSAGTNHELEVKNQFDRYSRINHFFLSE